LRGGDAKRRISPRPSGRRPSTNPVAVSRTKTWRSRGAPHNPAAAGASHRRSARLPALDRGHAHLAGAHPAADARSPQGPAHQRSRPDSENGPRPGGSPLYARAPPARPRRHGPSVAPARLQPASARPIGPVAPCASTRMRDPKAAKVIERPARARRAAGRPVSGPAWNDERQCQRRSPHTHELAGATKRCPRSAGGGAPGALVPATQAAPARAPDVASDAPGQIAVSQLSAARAGARPADGALWVEVERLAGCLGNLPERLAARARAENGVGGDGSAQRRASGPCDAYERRSRGAPAVPGPEAAVGARARAAAARPRARRRDPRRLAALRAPSARDRAPTRSVKRLAPATLRQDYIGSSARRARARTFSPARARARATRSRAWSCRQEGRKP